VRWTRGKLFVAITSLFIAGGICYFIAAGNPQEQRLLEAMGRFRAAKQSGGVTPADYARATAAVEPRHIPVLLRWLATPIDVSLRTRAVVFLSDYFPSLARRLAFSSAGDRINPNDAALIGFELLGTNAVAALPELKRLARTDYGKIAVRAMVPIGEQAWETGVELLASPDAEERWRGAFLLGALGVLPGRTVEILRTHLNDPDPRVQTEIRAGLAEFPSGKTAAAFSEILKSTKGKDAIEAVYGFHAMGTNALLWLIKEAELTTNQHIKSAVLGLAAFQNELKKVNTSRESRAGIYEGKRAMFHAKALQMGWYLYAEVDGDTILREANSNIVMGVTPDVEQLIRNKRSPTEQRRFHR
jgi:hypothetical protein